MDGRRDGKNEGRKEGGKEGRREGRKEGRRIKGGGSHSERVHKILPTTCMIVSPFSCKVKPLHLCTRMCCLSGLLRSSGGKRW